MKLHRNIYLWYVTTFLSAAAFTLPIWVIFNTETLGLSNTEAYVLGVLPWGLSVFLEIPSGAWSDRYGRARVYLMGFLLYTLSVASFIFFSDFIILLVFQLVGALGLAMMSGGIEALVHDSIIGKDKDVVYSKVHGNKMAITFFGRVVTVLAGGYLFVIDPKLPVIMTVVLYVMGIIVSLFYKEVRINQAVERTDFAHIIKTFSLMLGHRTLAYMFLLVSLFCLVGESLFAIYQPYFKSINIDVGEFGLLYAIISSASALGALVVAKIIARLNVFTVLLAMILSVALTLAALVFNSPAVAYVAILPSAFAFGLVITLQNTETQKLISSSHQSTALSIASLVRMAPYLVSMIGVGVMLDVLDMSAVNISLFVAALVLTVPFIVLWVRQAVW